MRSNPFPALASTMVCDSWDIDGSQTGVKDLPSSPLVSNLCPQVPSGALAWHQFTMAELPAKSNSQYKFPGPSCSCQQVSHSQYFVLITALGFISQARDLFWNTTFLGAVPGAPVPAAATHRPVPCWWGQSWFCFACSSCCVSHHYHTESLCSIDNSHTLPRDPEAKTSTCLGQCQGSHQPWSTSRLLSHPRTLVDREIGRRTQVLPSHQQPFPPWPSFGQVPLSPLLD